MSARRITPVLVALAALAVLTVLIASGGSDDRYRFTIRLDNALGLRDGSLVTVGGVQVGTVKVKLDRAHGDKVLVEARLDPGKGPIGRGARASISSVNLLGQKRLELDKGSLAHPLPSGASIPADRVTPSTDLDQVLAVLTPDVRSRLSVLLNEAGAGVVGRGTDLARLIRTLPGTIGKATQLVDGVAGDNRTLTDLVDHSDKLVADLTAQRAALGSLIDSAGQAAGSAATKRAQLRATLARAPGMLGSLQSFLGRLQATTVPLGPAARDISAVAPELLRTVDEIAPFQRAASPALHQATTVAPALTTLAAGATPVLTRATPTIGRLAAFAGDLKPVTGTLDRSVDNLIGTVDNWSRAVQYRDGLSHIFRGEAAVTPQTLQLILNRYIGVPGARAGTTRKPAAPARRRPVVPALSGLVPKVAVPKLTLPTVVPPAVKKALDDVAGSVGGTVDGLLGGLRKQPPPKQDQASSAQSLLDFLFKP